MLASSSRGAFRLGRQKHVLGAQGLPLASGPTPLPVRRNSQQRLASVAVASNSHVSWSSVDRDSKLDQGSSLRNGPWSFQPDNSFKGTRLRSPLAKYNLDLSRLVEKADTIGALRLCRDMKNHGVMPDLFTYNYLLQVVAEDGLYHESWGIFDDMLATGVAPDLTTFNNLIHAHRHTDSSGMWDVIQTMQEFQIPLTSVTFSHVIERYLGAQNLEMALHFMAELSSRGLTLELKIAQGIIKLATNLGHPRLALDLALNYESSSVRRLDNEIWVNCLIASAEALYAEGTEYSWSVVVHELNVQPDEGTCIAVLHTAARHALPDLAVDVLSTLKSIGAIWKEYHFSPVIAAFCGAKRLKDAFLMLDAVRSSDVEPITETVEPILEAIGGDIDSVDAIWATLDELRQEGRPVDILVMDAIVQACVNLKDLQRAVGAYKAYGDYDVKSSVNTYNILLTGCVDARHLDLGRLLLQDMQDQGVKPDAQTYEKMILLCLTGDTYEDAFFYLEEMKEQKHTPPLTVYEAIVRKCVSEQDFRQSIAVQEMKEIGYEVSEDLQAYISTNGSQDGNQNFSGSRNSQS